METLYTREGAEFTGTPTFSGRSYWGESYSPCSRCGGQGGSSKWYPDGGICYRCRGQNTQKFEYRKFRLYTAETLTKLNARAEAKLQAKKDAEAIESAIYLGTASEEVLVALEYAKESEHSFYAKAHRCGLNADEEREMLERYQKHLRAVEEAARRERETRFLGEIGEKITFTGTVVVNKPYEVRVGFRRSVAGYFHVIVTDDGQSVVYAGSKGFPVGITATFSATVKDHDFYQSARQTKVTRATLIESQWFAVPEGSERYVSEKMLAKAICRGEGDYFAESFSLAWDGEDPESFHGDFATLEEAQEAALKGARARLPAPKKASKAKSSRTRKAKVENEEVDVSELSFA